ncbi:Hypothetical protein FKW44_016993, partial [Caligus rogercresseyi]
MGSVVGDTTPKGVYQPSPTQSFKSNPSPTYEPHSSSPYRSHPYKDHHHPSSSEDFALSHMPSTTA